MNLTPTSADRHRLEAVGGIDYRASMALRVVAAFIERQGKVLLAQRPANKARAGFWEFPGGKVEPGEEDATALRRELAEELGVDARVGEALGVSRYRYDAALEIELHLYRVELTARCEPKGLEAQATSWRALGEIAEERLCEADRPLLRQLLRASSE